MKEESILFIVQQQEYSVSANNFYSLTKLPQEKRNIRKTVLPDWVSVSIFSKIKHYIETQDISVIDIYNPEEVQKVLWLGDLLFLENFQQRFIQEKILTAVNPNNCVMLLIEAHKKLKNSDKSLTCWYNLLNASMSYIASNMLMLYPKIKQDMKKLNEKILSQILERAVKNLRKTNYLHKKQIFQIIMQIKGLDDIGKVCEQLKQIVKKKRINPQIHANLSWKLKDLINIDMKKTKIFKFIDYQWRLQAQASHQNGKKQLNISLVLESKDGSQKSSAYSQGLEDFEMKGQPLSGYNQNKQQLFNSNDFQRLGVLYLKLVSKIQQNSYETDVRVNYLNIQQKQSIQLLQFNQNQLHQLGQKKIQITLYCSLQNVYTFILNYSLQNYDFTSIGLTYFCSQQLSLIAHFLIKDGKQEQAFHIILHLLHTKKSSQYEIRSIVLGLDYRILPKKSLVAISDMLKLVGYNNLNNQLMAPFKSDIKIQQPMSHLKQPTSILKQPMNHLKQQLLPPKNSSLQRINTSNNLNINQVRTPIESHSHSQTQIGFKNRADSKQRIKKIFESPRRKGNYNLEQQREQQKIRIDQQLDIKKFIYSQDSAFAKAFNDILKGF